MTWLWSILSSKRMESQSPRQTQRDHDFYHRPFGANGDATIPPPPPAFAKEAHICRA
ncbi:hypothetical protein PCASD_12532 [Puccinia coronata f. sp. avenae]|uniref:Uncharacterized protein n=1 Tax=Puccinia coronata f. sp. avenae TaxID=200324 RepID=A0A2N5TBW5_9BASI|nr:hypothetical protein PCASD_12532 [Puccinia coronata f. sp. avenae]